jgi:hypothetical protein
MAFEQFDDLALAGLKTSKMGNAKVLIKSDFKTGARTQTTFRFSDEVVEKAGWIAGSDRIGFSIDWKDRTIRAVKVSKGGYKLNGSPKSRANVKFAVAPRMTVCDKPTEISEAIVIGNEVVFVLPDTVRMAS